MSMHPTSGNEWLRHHGPSRPMWEPVRLVDFDGKRLEALRALRAELREKAQGNELEDEELVMHAILEHLFSQATINIGAAQAQTLRLATSRLPEPEGRRRKRLSRERREELTLLVGSVWSTFTRHNFPLPPQNGTEA